MSGRGGTWNRAGRRSGGSRAVPLDIVPHYVPPPVCVVPDCGKEAKVRIPATEGLGAVRVDGKWWALMCAEHAAQLLRSLDKGRAEEER